MPRFTIKYTRPEVVAGTDQLTGVTLRFETTIEAEDQRAALAEFADEYGDSDMRIVMILPHHNVPAGVRVIPTDTARAYYGPRKP